MKYLKEEYLFKINKEAKPLPFTEEEILFIVTHYYKIALNWCSRLTLNYGNVLRKTDAGKLLFFANLNSSKLEPNIIEKKVIKERMARYANILVDIINKEEMCL